MKRVTFRKSMMNGKSSEPVKGWLFDVQGHALVAHRIGSKWRITHFDTGLCVQSLPATTRAEAIDLFETRVSDGLVDMAKLAKGAAEHPTLNTLTPEDVA